MSIEDESALEQANEVRRKLVLAGLAGVAAQLDLPSAIAQDAAKVMPNSYHVVLENDYVRVLDFNGKPGMGICGEGWHSHPPHLTVVLADWLARNTTNGVTSERARKLGDVAWEGTVTHKVENIGTSVSRALIIELKALALTKS